MLGRKKEGEVGRGERIAREAQESLARSKLPPRMERDRLEREEKEARKEAAVERGKSQRRVKEVPDF